MKNSKYWAQRFTQLEKALHSMGEDAVREIERQYRAAQKQIEADIARWYQRLAANNDISLAEARKFLQGADLKEFKWDVWDYIKYGEENGLNGQWMKELENASAKFHISRLEALKIQTRQSLEALFAKQQGTVSGTMANVFESSYYHTAFEIQKGFGVGWDIAGLNQSQIEKVLSKPWAMDEYNFSERIWSNKEKLINEIHGTLTQNIMLGQDPQKAIDAVAKKMNTSKYNAGRLVMTEEAAFAAKAQQECYKELGVEKYEVVETFDAITCETCGAMDGKVFPMSEYQVGLTVPPFHPNCRGCTAPAFDDDFGEVGERAARDIKTGKTYNVPADMTYEEWKKQQDGGDVDKSAENGIIKSKANFKKPAVTAPMATPPKEKSAPKPDLSSAENPREYEKLDLEQFKKLKGSITADERKIVYGRGIFSGYVASIEAKEINEGIRNGVALSARRQEIADTLQKVISKNIIDRDIMVYRYVDGDALFNITSVVMPKATLKMTSKEFFDLMNALPSQIPANHLYTEKGFLSTSGVIDKNVMNKRPVMLQIRCPSGTHGYVTTNNRESEIIFGQGTQLRILGSSIVNSGTAECKVVLDCIIEKDGI